MIKKIFIVLLLSTCFFGFLYLLGFHTISQSRRVDLLVLKNITKDPIQKDITLWFSKGWQIRNEWMTKNNSEIIGKVKVTIKNIGHKPLMVILPLDSSSFSALDKEFNGFRKRLNPNQQELIYEGELIGFIGKIIKINNDGYLRTSFELSIEAEETIIFENPLKLFAYIPSQTI